MNLSPPPSRLVTVSPTAPRPADEMSNEPETAVDASANEPVAEQTAVDAAAPAHEGDAGAPETAADQAQDGGEAQHENKDEDSAPAAATETPAPAAAVATTPAAPATTSAPPATSEFAHAALKKWARPFDYFETSR